MKSTADFRSRTLVAIGVLLSGTLPVGFGQNATSPKPDNSKVNQKDRSKHAVTADDAKNNSSDIQLQRQIRKAVVADKSLSTYAHNVKVIARGGMVTLKGPVRSEEEKAAVEQKATEITGSGKVTNQITVAPAKSK